MPDLSTLFKAEITRLARKQLRSEIGPIKKALAGYRSDIAGLKKRLRALEIELKRAVGRSRVPAEQPTQNPTTVRFRPAGMKSHREKLQLSAKDYGLLLGASALSVYKWEDGKVKPRPGALARIAEVRQLGKREVTRRLQELRA